MKTLLVAFFVLFLPTFLHAQESQLASSVACLNYYKPDSVQVNMQPSLTQTIPGVSLGFSGSITNKNDYPLVDGELSVKIFRRDESSLKQGDEGQMVDQFVVSENVALSAKSSQDVKFEWYVPVNARGGEYYVTYFFTTSERYNLMGVSFIDNVTGNRAQFTVTNPEDPKTAFLDRNSRTLNDQVVSLSADTLHFGAEETVTAKVKVQNPSNQVKTLPVQWNQYSWDAGREENRQNTKTELVTLQPNEVKELSYTVLPSQASATFLTITTQDGDVKSMVNMRYMRDGIEEARMSFSGLTKFPIVAGEEQALFSCAQSTASAVVKDTVLTLTLKDKQDQIIKQYRYAGDMTNNLQSFGENFVTEQGYDYLVLEASLFQAGNEIDTVEIVYDCQKINPELCMMNADQSFFKGMGKKVVILLIATVGLAVLGALLFSRRRSKRNIQW